MAELVNLRPLFPGKKEADQLFLITQVLGDPCENYGFDGRGKPIGGGRWDGGVQMARDNFGFTFQKVSGHLTFPLPSSHRNFLRSHLEISLRFLTPPVTPVPLRLVKCMADLLKYDPSMCLTSLDCLEHPYITV
jgi:meiosis induction protein kinase IME2/SME1